MCNKKSFWVDGWTACIDLGMAVSLEACRHGGMSDCHQAKVMVNIMYIEGEHWGARRGRTSIRKHRPYGSMGPDEGAHEFMIRDNEKDMSLMSLSVSKRCLSVSKDDQGIELGAGCCWIWAVTCDLNSHVLYSSGEYGDSQRQVGIAESCLGSPGVGHVRFA